MTVLHDSKLERVLDRLHQESDAQCAAMMTEYHKLQESGFKPSEEQTKKYLSDKLVALDRDKAEFCYQICRAISARRIVEAGTSFGVSTVYLAAALRDNIRAAGGGGLVVGTEYEAAKVNAARALFQQTELYSLIDLRAGDLRSTLRNLEGPIDFMLV